MIKRTSQFSDQRADNRFDKQTSQTFHNLDTYTLENTGSPLLHAIKKEGHVSQEIAGQCLY